MTSVAFSPDGSRIVSGSCDKTVRLWDAGTGQPVGEPLRGHDDVGDQRGVQPRRHAASPRAAATRRCGCGTPPPGSRSATPLRGHDGAVTSVAFSPDGTRIASGSGDKTVRLWDAATGSQVGVLTGHRSAVESVAFSPDGRRLVSGGDDKTVRVWDAASWQPLLGHDDAASAQFSDDGRRIVSGSADRTVRWWDAATGRPIGEPLRVDDPECATCGRSARTGWCRAVA